jgi:UDP-N-acetylmuramoyl-tripeptide--D-alanyl-D-alanine ligase
VKSTHLFSRLPRPAETIYHGLRGRTVRLLTFVWRRLMVRTTVIAITGSVGKTTAKECLAAMLESRGPVLKTHQNQNDKFGVPRTIRRMRPWHRYAVVEVGTGAPGDIRRLARLLKPDIAIVLRVARTHTNMFGNLDNIATEKAELLSFLPRRGCAVLNADDARVACMADGNPCRTVFFGTAAACDYRAQAAASNWPERLAFELVTGEQTVQIRTQLVGTHWMTSVLAALAAGGICGVSPEEAADRVARVPPFMGRMQPVALPNGAIVMRDEENGSPDTLSAMLDVLRNARATRRWLVFSDQSDSRESPRRRLRNIGRLAARLCDIAVFVGDHAHHAAGAAIDSGMESACCREFVSLQDSAKWLQKNLRPGDLVFLKGRGTDHLSRILFAQFGNIGCWRSGCGITRLCDVCDQLKPDFDLQEALATPLPVTRVSG